MNSKGNKRQPGSQTARKSTGTRQITSVVTSSSDNSTCSLSSQTTPSRKARKSTGTRRITSVDNNGSADSTSGTSNTKTPSPSKARKSTATRPITRAGSNISSEEDIQSSNFISSVVDQSLPSTSKHQSQPVSSLRTQRTVNTSPNKRNAKNRDSYSLSQNSSDEELSVSNLDNLVNKCVSYILVADQKKYAIKKQDIIKNVFEHQDSKLYKAVIDKACLILKKTFGLEILNIENRKNEYLLINIIDRDLGTRDFAEYSSSELQKQGLVFYLLTLIYMNENVIGENELWKALKPLGIDVDSRIPHLVFGDVKKFITVELVKQMYLEYKCISKDPLQYEFVWGQRAKQEVGKEDLLEFACKVMGDTKPQDWLYQYNDAVVKDLVDE